MMLRQAKPRGTQLWYGFLAYCWVTPWEHRHDVLDSTTHGLALAAFWDSSLALFVIGRPRPYPAGHVGIPGSPG